MELITANRKNAKIKMAIQRPSGSGKTKGALKVAYGLCHDWEKIAVIDSENHSSELYADMGSFKVVHLVAPYTPERYMEAIQVCERGNMEVVIIDSISHEWDGNAGILEIHSRLTGNSYTNWNKLTPRHNAFFQYMLQSPFHVIGTIRSKQEYVLSEKNGKQVPEKVGMKGITREGMDYEFTLVFELDMKHNAIATKDRTSIFSERHENKMSPELGEAILDWCNLGAPIDNEQRINGCKTIGELLELFQHNPKLQDTHKALFSKRKKELSNTSNHLTHANSN